MADRAVFAARLLAEEMPADIEEVFEACDISLFPESYSDMKTNCSCPDSANPCKHLAAVFYILAERFDDDPAVFVLAVYDFLTWLQESLTQALTGESDE